MKRQLSYILLVLTLVGCNKNDAISPVKKDIREVVFASGIMEMENEYIISAKVDGILTHFNAREGDRVVSAQTIAELDSDVPTGQLNELQIQLEDSKKNAMPTSPQLQNLQNQIAQAEDQYAFDKQQYAIYKELWSKKSVSQLDFEKKKLQYEISKKSLQALNENYQDLWNSLQLNVQRYQAQLTTQQAVLKDYSIKTEDEGIILNVFKKQGELVRRGEEILKMGNGDYIIKLFVSEEDITKVRLNQKVLVSINTYLGKTYEAKVSKIHPGFNETEQSYIIEAKFIELPEQLFSGTQLQANIETTTREDVLLIPNDYVLNNTVKLKNGKDKSIETGFSNSDWTEVKSGITENDQIIRQ
jgi:macrolide-specific efflux system membrane fusion protein